VAQDGWKGNEYTVMSGGSKLILLTVTGRIDQQEEIQSVQTLEYIAEENKNKRKISTNKLLYE
jgi:hypothetical protein